MGKRNPSRLPPASIPHPVTLQPPPFPSRPNPSRVLAAARCQWPTIDGLLHDADGRVLTRLRSQLSASTYRIPTSPRQFPQVLGYKELHSGETAPPSSFPSMDLDRPERMKSQFALHHYWCQRQRYAFSRCPQCSSSLSSSQCPFA